MIVHEQPLKHDGRDYLAWGAVLLSCCLYIISFFLPAVQVLKSHAHSGWEAFLIVKRFIESPPLETIGLFLVPLWWLPNAALWAGVILVAIRRWRGAAAVGLLGLIGVAACGFDP